MIFESASEAQVLWVLTPRDSVVREICHVNQVSYLFQGTVLEPSTSHIGRGVALAAQAAAPEYPRVYKHPSISDSRNDHSFFP